MFNKPPRSSDQGQPETRLQATPQSSIDKIHALNIEPMPTTYEPPTLVHGSVIGNDLTILGENINIVSKESLQIDGEIHGDVSGKRVNIGNTGLVVGTISAETVEIDGGVQGTVRAKEVRLNADAKVSGELIHQVLSVSEGAEFEGRVHRPENSAELNLNLGDASTPAAKPQSLETPTNSTSEPAPLEPMMAPAS